MPTYSLKQEPEPSWRSQDSEEKQETKCRNGKEGERARRRQREHSALLNYHTQFIVASV